MKDPDILVDRNGSSEKYSKFGPHRGERLILTSGPKIMQMPFLTISSPKFSPMNHIKSKSNEQHVVQLELGKSISAFGWLFW